MGQQTVSGSYIDGHWENPAVPTPIPVINPTDESVLMVIDGGGKAEIAKAIAAAERAQQKWAALPAIERAEFMDRIANVLEGSADNIARSIAQDIGMPVKLSRGIQVGLPIETFRNVAKIGKEFAFEKQVGNSTIVMLLVFTRS